MRTVLTDICNTLMTVSIGNALRESGILEPKWSKDSDVVVSCRESAAEVALLEVAYNRGYTIEERLAQADALRKEMPCCRVVLMCDENSAPELGRRIAQAKKDKRIDEFVFSSVSEAYLVAMLAAV